MKSIGISLFCIVFSVLVCALPAHAAEKQPVVWSADITAVADGAAMLTVSGKIASGWHIYGFEMPSFGDEAGVPDPTSLELYLPAGVHADGEMKKSGDCNVHFDDFMNLNLPWITGTATFVQRLRVASGASGKIEGTVNYMACTEQACTPPAKYEFSLAFAPAPSKPQKVEEIAETVKDAHKGAVEAVEEQAVKADVPERHTGRAAVALAVAVALLAGAVLCFGACGGRRFRTARTVAGFILLGLAATALHVAALAAGFDIAGCRAMYAAWCVVLVLLSLYILGFLRFAGEEKPDYITAPRIVVAAMLLTLALCLYLSINITPIQ